MLRLLGILALLTLTVGPAFTQPSTPLPANTVWGRLGIGVGPGQAIPFATLARNLVATLAQFLGSNDYGVSVLADPLTKCNGTADDTAGITAVFATGAKLVFIPPGLTCRVSSVTVPAGVKFQWPVATLKHIGTGGGKIIRVGGDNVSVGPGTIDGNGSSVFAVEGIFCQNHSGLTIDGITFTNITGYSGVHTVDCTKLTATNNQFLGGDSVTGLGSFAFYYTSAMADIVIRDNFCDRQGSIAAGGQTCFNVVGDGSSIIRRFSFTNNRCVGVAGGGTLFQACLQNINVALADSMDGAVIANNQARYCNYCYTFDTLTSAAVTGNTARDILSVGYTFEASNCVNSTFSGNSVEGTMNSVGSMALINVANGCIFTGNTFKNATVDAAASTVTFNIAAPKGSKNIVSNNTITVAGGTAITVSNDNSIVMGNVISGGVTAINLTGGTGRIVVGNVVTGQSGTPIINADATDIICGNNVLGCNSATAGPAAIEFKASVNFNSANTDTSIPITLPPGFTRYRMSSVNISGASADISTATAGVFTAAAGAGVAIVTGASAITVTSATANTNNNAQSMTLVNAGTISFTSATLFFRVGTAQGSAATGTVTISIIPVS